MIAPQTFNNYPEFGVAAVKCCPDAAKYANGYIQGDVLPAEHLNWFLSGATVGVSALQLGMDSLEKEMQNLLCCAGITPSGSCNTQIYDAVMYQIQASANTKAPNMHASSATTYGVGNADCYGHLKISDTYTSVLSACAGVAASQKGLACVYGVANGKPNLGNTAGCALGTASAGTSGNAARADHVHPLPSCVQDKYTSTSRPIGIGYEGSGLTYDQIGNLAAYSANYESNCVVIKDAPKDAVQCWLGLGTAAYCAAGCFRASTWTPSVVDCSKRLVAIDNTAVCLVAEGGNELNMKFGTCTNVGGWLNYRGGVCLVRIGLGTNNGCLGDLQARCFYGNMCGNVCGGAGMSCTSGNAVARKNEGTRFWSVIATNAKQCDIFKVLSWINPISGTILGGVDGYSAQCLISSGDSSYTVYDSLGQNHVIWNTCTATLVLKIGGIN